MIDHTHDPAARSWIASAHGHSDFPVQNLPLGSFAPAIANGDYRCGTAIGDSILDLRAVAAAGLLPADLTDALRHDNLASLLALGRPALKALRHILFGLLLEASAEQARVEGFLYSTADCTMALPMRPGGYTDFYAGIVHATNVGRLLRPDNPLMPNYKWIPIGYHGRTSSIRPSGTDVRRPNGQIKAPDADAPVVTPSARVDYEVELGLWIAGGNDLGTTIRVGEASDHLAGVTLLNDWSARDVQAWEYQPLGPFLAKNFGSTVSPWLVTANALEPFRTEPLPRSHGDPAPLPYLHDSADQQQGAYSIDIKVLMTSAALRKAGAPEHLLGSTSALHMYWTPAQLIAHHASNGCNLEPGDLLGTGTISAPSAEGYGSLMELTRGGREPFTLPGGESRTFLEDGDEVIVRGQARHPDFVTIGFGECRAIILPAL